MYKMAHNIKIKRRKCRYITGSDQKNKHTLLLYAKVPFGLSISLTLLVPAINIQQILSDKIAKIILKFEIEFLR